MASMSIDRLPPIQRRTLLAIVAFFALGLVGLDAVPRMFGDESWYAMPTVSLLRDGTLRLLALEGRGGVDRAFLQPKLLPNLAALPAVALAGVHLWAFRLTALLVGVLGLLGVEAVGRRRFDADTGFVAVLLLIGNYWFFASARCFRPEVFELAALIWFFECFDRALEGRRVGATVAAGLIAAAAALAHQVSLALVGVTALTLLLATPVTIPRLRTAGGVAAVALAALAPYLVYVAFASRLPGVSFYQQMTTEAGDGSLSLAGVFLKEQFRWKNYFLWPFGVSAAAVSAVVLFRAARDASEGARRVAWVVLASLAVFAVLVPLLTGRYAVVVAPFFALLVAREVVGLWRRAAASPRSPWVARLVPLAVALAFSGPSLATMLGTAVLHRRASYAQIIRSLRAVTGDAPVAGPVAFWLGFADVPYTVTNVAPDSVSRAPGDAPWLVERVGRNRPRFVLETTTSLQATDGLGARPAVFPPTALGDLAARLGRVVAVVPSRDFGPIRVWRVDTPGPTGSTRGD